MEKKSIYLKSTKPINFIKYDYNEYSSNDFKKIISNIFYSYIIDNIINNYNYIYLDLGPDLNNNVSYLPKDKLNIVKDKKLDVYNNNYRRITKFGKLLKNTIFKNDLKNVEKYTNLYKAYYKKIKKLYFLDIVEEDDIKHWYLSKNTSTKSGGNLTKSCMRYEHNQKQLNFYSKHKDVCKMLILKENKFDDKIQGRALLWKTNLGWYMDNIYTTFDSDYDIFLNYAKKENMITYFNNKNFDLYVKVSKTIFDSSINYPYLDTFKFYFYLNGIISNKNKIPNKKTIYKLPFPYIILDYN